MASAPQPCFWLASYPKSGNTWVRLLLNAYSLGAVHINANANLTAYDCNDYLWQALAPHAITDMRVETVMFLRHAVLLHILYGHTHRPIIIKTHNARLKFNGIELIPPDLTAGGVYLVRDPRDVVVSFSRHLGQTIDETLAVMDIDSNRLVRPGTGIASILSSWSRHVRSWVDAEGTVVVRYEDLITDTAKELSRIIKAFRLRVNDEKVSSAVEMCKMERLKQQEEESSFIEIGKQEKFFGQGKGWQNELTEKQARRIKEDHAEVMERFGYE
jgi:aryl sulfotransferase